MQATDCHGATLIFSDTQTEANGAIVVDAERLEDAYDGFDQGIIDLRKETSFRDTESLLQQLFVFFDKVRQGGRIIVPNTTYNHLPYGMDILAKVAGLRVEAPLSGDSPLFVATVS